MGIQDILHGDEYSTEQHTSCMLIEIFDCDVYTTLHLWLTCEAYRAQGSKLPWRVTSPTVRLQNHVLLSHAGHVRGSGRGLTEPVQG